MVEAGFFDISELNFTAWNSNEIYGGWYWSQTMNFYQTIFEIGVYEKINIFLSFSKKSSILLVVPEHNIKK